ncbi:hypothetical protein SAMN05216535_3921 [Stutzerimonas xanthomarina]|uniref:Uncharacterized protein n=2 Tax=Stutzerimonas xanthomarina TaxID=271420 RepID=A0A1M5KK05_9GAMM|nr:hypothetical protein SAMN05216535_3921 [Stutzerimonas xanthomarina]SHG53106.1 hypothetical protein SAMN02744645_0526 [Stutzerimonas xanthomarina DSM 18231]
MTMGRPYTIRGGITSLTCERAMPANLIAGGQRRVDTLGVVELSAGRTQQLLFAWLPASSYFFLATLQLAALLSSFSS